MNLNQQYFFSRYGADAGGSNDEQPEESDERSLHPDTDTFDVFHHRFTGWIAYSKVRYFPVGTQRCFNVHLTFLKSIKRYMNVKTTLCASWVLL